MNNISAAELGIDVDEIEANLNGDHGFPLHLYYDPKIFEFELEAIFHRKWQYFAPLGKLTEVGNVVPGVVGRVPVIVTRARDGILRGFINICRHRGYSVVEKAKRCNLLTCRYHGWTYHLDGRLVRAPHTESETTFDGADFGLQPVSVDVWAQGVFVNPDPHAIPLRTALPDLDDWTREKGFSLGLDDYKVYRQTIIDQDSN